MRRTQGCSGHGTLKGSDRTAQGETLGNPEGVTVNPEGLDSDLVRDEGRLLTMRASQAENALQPRDYIPSSSTQPRMDTQI